MACYIGYVPNFLLVALFSGYYGHLDVGRGWTDYSGLRGGGTRGKHLFCVRRRWFVVLFTLARQRARFLAGPPGAERESGVEMEWRGGNWFQG